jgi:hypothetical protein
MKKVVAVSVLALGIASLVGCGGGLPGMQCKFAKGDVSAEVTGDAHAFLESAMTVKKTSDQMKKDWDAEIAALAADLKVEAKEEVVLATINANVSEVKAKAQCEVKFEATVEAGAQGSADADGKAGTGGNSGSANAQGSAYVDAKVTFDLACKVKVETDAALNAKVTVTKDSVLKHFPRLLGIAARAEKLAKEAADLGDKGAALAKSAGSADIKAANEVNCAVSAMADVKAQVNVQVSFSAKASASAKGEGSAKAG